MSERTFGTSRYLVVGFTSNDAVCVEMRPVCGQDEELGYSNSPGWADINHDTFFSQLESPYVGAVAT
jgi:hypothetical protein